MKKEKLKEYIDRLFENKILCEDCNWHVERFGKYCVYFNKRPKEIEKTFCYEYRPTKIKPWAKKTPDDK